MEITNMPYVVKTLTSVMKHSNKIWLFVEMLLVEAVE